MPQAVDLIVHGRWIIPVVPSGAVLEDHAVVVDGGRIVGLEPTATVGARFVAREEHTFARHALVPGLVNAHTHAAMTLLRGYADDCALMTWLEQRIWPAEGRWVGPEFVAAGTRLAVAEMLLGGTTCFADMYYFPEQAAQVAAETGIRAAIGLIVLDLPTVWAANADEYLARGLALADRVRGQPRLHPVFAPHAPYTTGDDTLERVRVLAEELDLPVTMHVHETADEVARSIDAHGCRPLERLRRLGLVSARLAAVHMTQLEPEEIATIADAGVSVVHCPESNLKLASGLCPVQRLREAGVNVALGTDGAASNNDLDLMGEMRTAALVGKVVAGDAAAVPAADALAMATLGGARALGLEETIGSIEPGKQADLVAIDLGGLETQPLYHPLSQLVYAASRHCVEAVWVAGRQLVAGRRLGAMDVDAAVAEAATWARRIADG